MQRLIKTLVLPPLNCFLLAGLGLLIRPWRPRIGKFLVAFAILLLWLLSTPLIAFFLIDRLQTDQVLDPSARPTSAQAIVILSADMDQDGREFGGTTAGKMTLQRLRHGAWVHRQTNLPILVTGGREFADKPALGNLMKSVLEDEFQAPVRWVEDRAGNTRENALFSAALLREEAIEHVILVTHAWHLPRARTAFEAAGMKVTAAPTAFANQPTHGFYRLLPSARALETSRLAMHEWLGSIWYSITE